MKNSGTIQGLLQDFPTVFKDCKLMKNTNLHVKIIFLKSSTALLKIQGTKIPLVHS